MSAQNNPNVLKCSVSAHYSHQCCPYCNDRFRWGNKKRGGFNNSKRKTLRTHRTGIRR